MPTYSDSKPCLVEVIDISRFNPVFIKHLFLALKRDINIILIISFLSLNIDRSLLPYKVPRIAS